MSTSRSRPNSSVATEAAELLLRYPNLAQHELRRLTKTFRQLSLLEIRLMTAQPNLSGKLDAFRREHRGKLMSPLFHTLLFLTMPTILIFGIFWGFWDLINGG